MTQEKEHASGSAENSAQGLHIIEQVEDILWACDLDLKFIYLSPVSEKNSGYSTEQRKQLDLQKTLTPTSLSIVQEVVKKHIAINRKPEKGPDKPIRCLLDLYRKDGSTYPIEASISFTRNDRGELTGLVGSNRNITERIRAEAIIKAIHDGTIHTTGEQYLSNLTCHLCEILDQRYAFIAQINEGISQTLAFCKDGVISENFSYNLAGSPCEHVVAGDICYYPKNATQLFPHEEGMKRMGVESYIGTPIPDAKGEVQGLLVIMHDQPMEDIPLLTRVLEVCADRVGAEMSRRKTQKRLEESEQRFQALFEQSIDPCFIHNVEGRILNYNHSMVQIFGYSAEELSQLKTTQLVSNEKNPEALTGQSAQDVMLKGSTRFETLLKKKSGESFPAEVTTQLIHIEGESLFQTVFRDLSEQYRLREEEENKQRTLARLFDDLQTLIIILNTDGSVSYTNTTPLSNPDARLASQSDAKMWEYQAFSHNPKTQALIKADIARAIRGKSTQNDLQILTPDGLTWIQASIHPMLNSRGQVTQLLIEGSNIDQRKKMAEELQYADRRRKLFREQAPMPVAEWNIETYTISGWNDAAEALFGFTFEEANGQGPEFFTPSETRINKEDIYQALSSSHNKIISKNRCKDGRIVLCEWYNSSIKDASGNIIAVVSIIRDITAEHEAQQVLKNRDTEQREILNSMLDAVFTMDETSKILTFNNAAEKLWGYKASEVIGQSCWPLIAEPFVKQHRHYLQRYIETQRPEYLGISKDIKGKRKDNSTFPSRMAIAALGNKIDGSLHFIISLQDLSHVKQQEEKLRRSQKMDALGKLTGGIAHDFNNMLGIIMGYADLLQGSIKNQPKLQQYADEIFRAGQRGAQLTEKLLGFSRNKTSVAEQLSINTILQEQEHMLTKVITPRIKLAYDLTNNLWPIYVDGGDLSDAILNISINAMHAMPEGGQLSIATRNETINELDAPLKGLPAGDYALLSISDTGCGMNQETQEKIFDPFFSTKGELGTGLGLSQVYGFVERSKGGIKTYSEPNHGTQLSLYFPCYHNIDAQNNRQPRPFSELISGGQETILIVDDEAALLDLSTEILRLEGYKVIPVTNGHQALKVLKDTPVDLLFSDVIMPEMDGYQLAAMVQKQYPQVKIQLASGFTDDRHSDKLSVDLLNNMIQKPFNIKEVLIKIRHLLDE